MDKGRHCLHCNGVFFPQRTASGRTTENYCNPMCAYKAWKEKQQ